jgi:hypothetical protein
MLKLTKFSNMNFLYHNISNCLHAGCNTKITITNANAEWYFTSYCKQRISKEIEICYCPSKKRTNMLLYSLCHEKKKNILASL